jgi:hypothetical protein
MKAGRKPTLTFSEQVKLRSIQAAFGNDSPEEAQFWEQASTSAKLRRAIKRGKCIKPKPRKYKCYKDAHNAANRAYYQRHKDRVSEKNRRWYERNKERKKAYYAEHKEHIRAYYKGWYDEQKEAK